MEFVTEHTNEKEKVCNMNKVWQFKKVFLLFELVRKEGGQMTDCYYNKYEQSTINWNYESKTLPEPTRKQFNQWKKFIQWL